MELVRLQDGPGIHARHVLEYVRSLVYLETVYLGHYLVDEEHVLVVEGPVGIDVEIRVVPGTDRHPQDLQVVLRYLPVAGTVQVRCLEEPVEPCLAVLREILVKDDLDHAERV